MQSVTSNAVASAIQNQKIFIQNTQIGTFTLASNQTVSPDITQYVHTPPTGYSRLCSLYSYGQNYYQMSVNFTSTNRVYATITNHYDYPLTTDVYLFEIFMPSNILP
jgi:hypothetical protein